MENNGLVIDVERGRIRISKKVDDALGNPDYISFVASDFRLSMFAEDQPEINQRKVRRDKSVELNDRATVRWICNIYGFPLQGKYAFDADILLSENGYTNVDICVGAKLAKIDD